MRKILNLLLITIIPFLYIACSGSYTIEDNGSTINLSNDDPFEIQLKGNASTGYSWQVISYDSTIIQQVGDKEYVPNDDKVGSPGMVTFKFKTIGIGETSLILVYKRSWEELSDDDKSFTLKVVVGTMGRIEE